MVDSCISYHPSPVCGIHVTCTKRTQGTVETEINYSSNSSSNWICQCQPGCSETPEASPFFEVLIAGHKVSMTKQRSSEDSRVFNKLVYCTGFVLWHLLHLACLLNCPLAYDFFVDEKWASK